MTDLSEKALENVFKNPVVKEAVNTFVKSLCDVIVPLVETALNAINPLTEALIKAYAIMLDSNPKAKRVTHLALHSKKKRIRKKNLNRLQRDVAKKIGL